jgi:CHRD domain-containing protein
MRVTRTFTAVAIVTLVGLACKDDTVGIPADVEIYRARPMNGANERPTPVTTTATGEAVITIIGNLVSWKVDVTNLTGTNAGHIHRRASDSTAGGVIQGISPTTGGTNFTGTIALGSAVITVDSILAIIRAGRAYVNLHTTANGGGEIRGDLVRQ